MTAADLLPCPFCGGAVYLKCDDYINGRIIDNPDYVIECDEPVLEGACCVFLKMYDQDADRLVAAWSRRAIPLPA